MKAISKIEEGGKTEDVTRSKQSDTKCRQRCSVGGVSRPEARKPGWRLRMNTAMDVMWRGVRPSLYGRNPGGRR